MTGRSTNGLPPRGGGKAKLGVFFSHPTQHHSALFQALSRRSDLDVRVYYYGAGALQSADGVHDDGFGRHIIWDVDLLDGTNYRVLSRITAGKRLGALAQINPEVVSIMRNERFDAVFVCGYLNASNNLVVRIARSQGALVLYQGDSNIWDELRKPQSILKRVVRRRFFANVDRFLLIGDCNRDVYLRYGCDPRKFVWCPIPVDVLRFDRIQADTALRDRLRSLRSRLDIPTGAKVVAMCGKLVERKRPQDLVAALKILGRRDVCGLLIGSGPMEDVLRQQIGSAAVQITGFVNQSAIPDYMLLADVGVVTSEWDPHPLVATEFAACGVPLLVSHLTGVTGAHDVVRPGQNGDVYECGNVEQLAHRIGTLLDDDALRLAMGARSKELAREQSTDRAAAIIAQTVLQRAAGEPSGV